MKQIVVVTAEIDDNKELSEDLINLLDKHGISPFVFDRFSDVLLAAAVERAIANGTARIKFED